MAKIKNVLKYIVFLAIGIALFYIVYRGLDITVLKNELKNIKWGWIWLSFILAIISHLSRAIRWYMLIKPMGFKPKLTNTFISIFIMYASNLLVTRSGELARCTILTKYEKIPFGKLAGTVVIERATDTLVLFIIFIATIFAQFKVFNQFLLNNPEIEAKIGFIFSPWFLIIITVGTITSLFLIWKFRKKLRQIKIVDKIFGLLYNFFEGLKSIKKLEKPWLYIFHSVVIYVMYFLMMYVVFFSFIPTKNISFIAGLTSFIMGAFAMLAPVQGGIGAWHFMVIESLSLYGIDKTNGQIFALISHTSMNLMLLVVGALCFIALPFINAKKAQKN